MRPSPTVMPEPVLTELPSIRLARGTRGTATDATCPLVHSDYSPDAGVGPQCGANMDSDPPTQSTVDINRSDGVAGLGSDVLNFVRLFISVLLCIDTYGHVSRVPTRVFAKRTHFGMT